MLRTTVARSASAVGRRPQLGIARQWLQPPASSPGFLRGFADNKPVDKTIVPGVQTGAVAGVPQAPVLTTMTSNPTSTHISPSQAPKVPPTPDEVGSRPAAPPPTQPPPPPPRRRFRTFLLSLIFLSALGYAGGVYYSLVSDNFHDFFTEYIPYGEDAVAYFEEREFRKRFPSHLGGAALETKSWPQTRGEDKVTIGRQSGLQPRVANQTANAGSDLGAHGKHVSAVEDNQKTVEKPQKTPAAKKEAKSTKSSDRKDSGDRKAAKAEEKTSTAKVEARPAEAEKIAAPPVASIDHLNVPQAEEPVVQDLVKLVNNIITAVNASSDSNKLAPAVTAAKDSLSKALVGIAALKEQIASDAEAKIKDAHTEFDGAAKELVRRLEAEMQDQEAKWKDEYESERENLSKSYQQKLSTELDAVRKVAEEQTQTSLLEQEIALQQRFMDTIKSQVEAEREGRLSKLDQLSSSVTELEKLTGEWNSVVDATLQTQHVQVALEAVRSKLQDADLPKPFLDELVVLKEVSKDDEVITAAIASIPPVAYQRGIPSIASLIDRFRRVAAEVRKASLLPEDAGVASHAASAVLSRFLFQKKTERGLPEGDDVEATLARTEVLLEEGDLDAAAREMNALKGWAGVLSKDWVSECRRVLEVRQAVEVIATGARLQSLLVE